MIRRVCYSDIQSIYFSMEVKMDITESITSTNADIWKQKIGEVFDAESVLVLNAENMPYISSAGLRVLLHFQKLQTNGRKVRVINASESVMNIMRESGFLDILDVSSAPREISLENAKLIGKGGTGECWQIADETVVKLYYDFIPESIIENDKIFSKSTFIAGIPTAISYGIVKCGNRRGIIFEMLNAKTLANEIIQAPDRIEEFGRKYAQLAKLIHHTKGDAKVFPRWTDNYRNNLASYSFLDGKEINNAEKLLATLNNYDTYVHGDFNPNNIMVSDGELMLIDMGSFSLGCPLIDLASLCFTLCYNNSLSDNEVGEFTGLTGSQQRTLWRIFISEYFSVENNDAAIENIPEMKIINQILILQAMMIVPAFPQYFSKTFFDKAMTDIHALLNGGKI